MLKRTSKPALASGFTPFLLLFLATGVCAETVAVLYPKIREPYLTIFLTLTEGVESKIEQPVAHYQLPKIENPERLNAWLREHNVCGIVALGKRGLHALPTLTSSIPAVVGAVTLYPNGHSLTGISRFPSPRQLFELLQQLKPGVRQIHVVYFPGFSPWLATEAQQAATAQGLTLNALNSANIHHAAEHYRTVLDQMDAQASALWLPRAGIGLETALLEYILEVAWEKKLTVFSSSFADVKRGVLFSVYPDNQMMGQSLAMLLRQRQLHPDTPPEISLAENLRIAVNLRTAEHLGLHFSKKEKREFGFMYPPP